MASRKLLLRAARLLEQRAAGLREGCEGLRSLWACGDCPRDSKGRCPSKVDHDRLASTAKALREAA